jgi:hypothetical protein
MHGRFFSSRSMRGLCRAVLPWATACLCIGPLSAQTLTPAPQQPARGLADHVATYNALPDTRTPLVLASEDGDHLACHVPRWAQTLSLTGDEAAALVALAGAYCPPAKAAPVAAGRRFTLPEYVVGLLADAAVNDELNKTYDNRMPPFRPEAPAPVFQPRQHPIKVERPDVRFVRLISALESCPSAFASLSARMEQARPDSHLTALAREARTIDIAFAVPPRSTCER